MVDEGRLDVPIARVYPLTEVRDAYRELERLHTRGKIVLEDGVFLAHAPLSVPSPIRRVSGDVGRQTPGPENTSSAAYRTKSGPEPAQRREMVKARQLR